MGVVVRCVVLLATSSSTNAEPAEVKSKMARRSETSATNGPSTLRTRLSEPEFPSQATWQRALTFGPKRGSSSDEEDEKEGGNARYDNGSDNNSSEDGSCVDDSSSVNVSSMADEDNPQELHHHHKYVGLISCLQGDG